MSLQIQPNIHCENCIKCGARPQVQQIKKYWIISCPNNDCKNIVKDEIVNFAAWNRLNKTNTNIKPNQTLKKIA
ncbi:hypothetical protein [Mucilaginibacter sp. SG564]|uniref:hypothetical protein n=1 Tax=unclassified Mucilaginibacter TaxID=2617802 RepID=UPI001555E64A|nr:hypothetical protein [Mucilaginibacter sp. SG564]NOW97324.1 hypothetical protein [Mucilaginibacter sp. SG564]